MDWLAWVWVVLAFLVLAGIVGLLLSVVRTSYRVRVMPDHYEADITTRTMFSRFRVLALRVGDREEVSVEIALLRRLMVFRLEYPRISMGMRNGRPSFILRRQVEVGSGTADPVKDNDQEVSLQEIMANLSRINMLIGMLKPHIGALRRHTTMHGAVLSLRQSTGEPASTAIVHGLVCSILSVLVGLSQGALNMADRPRLDVEPIFGKPYLGLQASGHVRVGLPHLVAFMVGSMRTLWPHVKDHVRLPWGANTARSR